MHSDVYKRKEVSLFLKDADSLVVLEAARAINDEPVPSALPDLAAVSIHSDMPDALLRRVMNANFRLGTTDSAVTVAKIASDNKVPESLRLEAIEELNQWNEPSPLDRVLGRWQPFEKRDQIELAGIVGPIVPSLFQSSEKIKTASTGLAANYGIKAAAPLLAEMVIDSKRPVDVRVASLVALNKLDYPKITDVAKTAIKDTKPKLRVSGRNILAQHRPDEAIPVLEQAINKGQTREKQGAIQTLATLKSPAATEILARWMHRLVKQDVPSEIQLDLLKAAEQKQSSETKNNYGRNSKQIDQRVMPFLAILKHWRVEAHHADVIFFMAAVILRADGAIKSMTMEGEVGPDLSSIGIDKNRRYLLEAIVAPNKAIAKGFETAVLAMLDGKVIVGIIRKETDKEIILMDAKGTISRVNKADIDERVAGKSAMPEEIVKHLSKDDLRDLVEFLFQQKQKKKETAKKHEG